MQIECVLMHKYCCVTHGCCLVWIFVFIFTATAKKRKNKNNTKWLRDFKCVSWFQISLRFKIKNFTLEILEKVSDHCVLFLAWIILKFHPTLISSSKTIYHAWVFFNILFHIRVFFYIISFWLDISSVPPPSPSGKEGDGTCITSEATVNLLLSYFPLLKGRKVLVLHTTGKKKVWHLRLKLFCV